MTGNSFGLQEEAFRLTPDPRFLFPTRSVVQALSGLLTGIAQRKGLLQLTGESGTGKTAVMQKLAQDLEASNSFVFAWTHPHLPFDDLILACAEKAGLRLRAGGRDDRVRSLTDKVTQMLSGAATAVILIDEAEKCSDEVLEGLRALAKIDHGMSWAWQVVLTAPLSFEARLQEDKWQALHQEIGVRVALERLRGPEVRAYIAHRLHIAGLTRGALFTPEALSRIETYAAGIPRLVNRLCSRALAEAAIMGAYSVTADMVDVAAREFSIVQSSAQGVVTPPSAPTGAPAAPIAPTAPFNEMPPAPAAAPAPAAVSGAALLGSMFRQFAEESHYKTELSAPPAANQQAAAPEKVEPPVAAEPPPVAEHAAPAAPVEATAPLDLTQPLDAAPEGAAEIPEPPVVMPDVQAAEPPAPVAETPTAPQPAMAAPEAEPLDETPPTPEPAPAATAPDPLDEIPPPEPDAIDEPAKTAEPEAADAASEQPKETEPAAAEAAAAPDPEKIALKAAIAATIAASEAKTTLAAPTEDDRLVPANDAEPAPPSRLAGQAVKVAAAVVIGLAVGALGAYVIQLRPTGSDQVAAVRSTTQDTAPRPQAAIEPPPAPPATIAAAPIPEPTPAPVAPAPTLNRITPSAGPNAPSVPPAPPPPPVAMPEPPARPNGVASAEKPADAKPDVPSEAPPAPVAVIPPPPPPKPPMETPAPVPPVVSAPPPPVPTPPPPPVVSAPPPAAAVPPPAVAEIPPPPPPKPPMPEVAPVTPPAPSPAPQVNIPPPPPPAPAPPPRVVQTPPPAPQIAAVEPPRSEDMGPPVDAIAEPPRAANQVVSPTNGRPLLPILPPSSPAPSADTSGRALAPILPAPAPPAATVDVPAPAPAPSARALPPILPPAPPPAAAPPPVETVTPKIAEAPLPAPQPEPPAPQIARAEPKVEAPTPLAPPPVEKPVVEAPAPEKPAAVAPIPEKPPVVARVEPPPAPPAPPAPAAPVPLQRPTASLSSAAVDRLMLRGDEVMRTGDPAAARLFYELAAANGSAAAATAVGRTWDPVEHARLGIQGSLASSQRAVEWYRKASAAGDADAETRLRALTAWMARNPGR